MSVAFYGVWLSQKQTISSVNLSVTVGGSVSTRWETTCSWSWLRYQELGLDLDGRYHFCISIKLSGYFSSDSLGSNARSEYQITESFFENGLVSALATEGSLADLADKKLESHFQSLQSAMRLNTDICNSTGLKEIGFRTRFALLMTGLISSLLHTGIPSSNMVAYLVYKDYSKISYIWRVSFPN